MIKYELKKMLGNKFVLCFFAVMFIINAGLSYYSAPLARDELNLPSRPDAETQAKVDAMYERYEEDPEAFMAELAECQSYVKQQQEAIALMIEKNEEAILMGEAANYTVEDFWPEYNNEIAAKINEYHEIYRYFNRVNSYISEKLPAMYDNVIAQAKSFQKEYIAYGMSEYDYEYRYQSDIIDIYSVNKNLPIHIEDRNGWDAYFTYTNGNICLILYLLVLTPTLLLDEKKSGIFSIIRTTRRGRVALIAANI